MLIKSFRKKKIKRFEITPTTSITILLSRADMVDRNDKLRKNTITSPSKNMVNWKNCYEVLDTLPISITIEEFQSTADLPTHSRIKARTNVHITKKYIAKQSSRFNASKLFLSSIYATIAIRGKKITIIGDSYIRRIC